ncbi:27052_t:CDS:2, partial [Racocetra persica]
LQSKLGAPITDTDVPLYTALKTNLDSITPELTCSRCVEVVNNFNRSDIPITLGNIVHNKEWKEEESNLLEEIWNNPAFATSEIRSTQSEGTYVTD